MLVFTIFSRNVSNQHKIHFLKPFDCFEAKKSHPNSFFTTSIKAKATLDIKGKAFYKLLYFAGLWKKGVMQLNN